MISSDDINSINSFISKKSIPWLQELISKSNDRSVIQIVSYLIKEIEENLCSLLPYKIARQLLTLLGYYKYIDLTTDQIDSL